MPLTDFHRELLQKCLSGQPRAWEEFVDHFLGFVVHVVNHTAESRSIRLNSQDREDLCSDVFLGLLENDFAVLRHFRGESSLITYLMVVARRIVIRRLMQNQKFQQAVQANGAANGADAVATAAADTQSFEERINDQEQVQHLLNGLDDQEATVVRMYHLEGHSYREISSRMGIPVNSIGPTLTRARARLRSSRSDSSTSN